MEERSIVLFVVKGDPPVVSTAGAGTLGTAPTIALNIPVRAILSPFPQPGRALLAPLHPIDLGFEENASIQGILSYPRYYNQIIITHFDSRRSGRCRAVKLQIHTLKSQSRKC